MKARRMALRVRAAFFSLIRHEVRAFRPCWPVVSDRAEGWAALVVIGLIGELSEFWLPGWQLRMDWLLTAVLSIRASGMYLLLSSVLGEMWSVSICGWLYVVYELDISSLSLRFFHHAAVWWVMVGQMVLCPFLCCFWSVCGLTSSTLRELLWQDLWETKNMDK